MKDRDDDFEALDRYRAEADAIDVYKCRRRRRLIYAVALGGLLAGLTFVVGKAIVLTENPCQRVHDYLCNQDPESLNGKSYRLILEESESDPSGSMRSNIRAQCERKIERLAEDGKVVP